MRMMGEEQSGRIDDLSAWGPFGDHTSFTPPNNRRTHEHSAVKPNMHDVHKRLVSSPGGQVVAGSNPVSPTYIRGWGRFYRPHLLFFSVSDTRVVHALELSAYTV
jgi:hypothetical protein